MRTALLLSAATLALMTNPAQAAQILYSSSGDRSSAQRVEQGGVSQIALENGTIVSIVGPADFTIRGEEIILERGGVTIAGNEASNVVLRLPGNGRVEMAGSGSLNVDETGTTGNVMRGRMDVVSGATSRSFAMGQNWAARFGQSASRVFANGAQSSPQGQIRRGPQQTVADAAAEGQPVTLGEALAGIGAAGDVIAASRNIEAYLTNPATARFPRGDVRALIGFSDQLAAAYSGQSFAGASPSVINTYLQFLADGGQIGAFQSAYAQLVSQYLTLLREGGLASEFQGANLAALNSYLAYLQQINGLGRIPAGQQDLLSAYLEFLAQGGVPANFIAPANLLTDDALAAYVAAISGYANFLGAGGNPGDFGTSAGIIEAYLRSIADSGLLDQLFGAQAIALNAYLEFLASGGTPADFDGFGPGGTISEALAQQYAAAIEAYVAFLQNGGAVADFQGGAGIIATYLQALQNAGLFNQLLGAQADTLNAYLAFINGGGNPGDFTGFGISQALAQQYAEAVQAFLAFIEAGGLPSAFTGLSAELFKAYLAALANFDLLDSLLAGQADFLNAYLAFLQGGGALDEFDLLPQPLTTADKLAALQNFMAFIRANGNPSEWDGATLAALQAFYAEGDVNVAFFNADELGYALFNEYRTYLSQSANPDEYNGLPVNGGTIQRLNTLYSVVDQGGNRVRTFGTAGGNPVVLDQERKFARSSNISGIPLGGTVLPLNEDAVYSELFLSDDLIVGRVTNVRTTDFGQINITTADQGAHYVMLSPLTALPGDVTVDYGLTYATSPTFADGSSAPGTFDAAVRIQFSASGQTRLATVGSIAMPTDATYSFTTPGGLDGVGTLGVTGFVSGFTPLLQQTNIALTGTGKACLSGADCTLYLTAAPGGTDAQFLGVSYETRNGGEGAITLHGAAGFTAGTGGGVGGGVGGGGGGDAPGFSTELVGAAFDTDFVGVAWAFERLNAGVPFIRTFHTRSNVPRAADGSIGAITTRQTPPQTLFDRLETEFLDQRGDDRGLLLTFGPGEVNDSGALTEATGNSVVAMVPNAATFLPVSGTVTYNVLHRTPAYSIDAALGNGVFDAQLAVAFGSLPRIGLEGTLTFDTTYNFASSGGLADPAINRIFARGDFAVGAAIDGTGSLCAAGATCSLVLRGTFSDDYERVATSWNTSGSALGAYGAAIFGVDEVPGLSFSAGDGIASGTLAAAFDGTQADVTYIDAGGSNRILFSRGTWRSANVTFDARGLRTASAGSVALWDRGTMQTADLAGTAYWQVGRYTGGQFASGDLVTNGGSIWGQDNGFAYAAIQPINGALPSMGTITYTLLGATRPTYHDARTAPGTFDASMALLLGTTPKIGLEGLVTMPDGSYAFASTGGVADPGSSEFSVSAFRFAGTTGLATTGAAPACGNEPACQFHFTGVVGGENGELATLAYLIQGAASSATATNPERPNISGAAVFGGTLSGGPFIPEGTTVADQVVAYAATGVGTDTRNTASVIYSDTTLAPLAHQWELDGFTSENERPNIGTNTENESGGVAGIIGWTRWAGGETAGRYFDAPTIEIPANGGWHEVAGSPATNLPASGTVQYELIGSTNPTIRDGSLAPGSFAGELAVAFGATPMVGVELDVTIGGHSYAINTPGGIADPMAGGMPVSPGSVEFGTVFSQPVLAQGDGPVCGGGGDCVATMRGILAGDGASHVGLVYTFGNTGFDTQVDGAAVFGRTMP